MLESCIRQEAAWTSVAGAIEVLQGFPYTYVPYRVCRFQTVPGEGYLPTSNGGGRALQPLGTISSRSPRTTDSSRALHSFRPHSRRSLYLERPRHTLRILRRLASPSHHLHESPASTHEDERCAKEPIINITSSQGPHLPIVGVGEEGGGAVRDATCCALREPPGTDRDSRPC